MLKKWHEWIIHFPESGTGNIIAVSGAGIILLSFLMPWFYGSYAQSRIYVSAATLIADMLYGLSRINFITAATLIYLVLVSLYTLCAKKPSKAPLLSLFGILFLSITIYLMPVEFKNLSAGVYFAHAGLLLIALSFFSKGA